MSVLDRLRRFVDRRNPIDALAALIGITAGIFLAAAGALALVKVLIGA